MATEKFKLGPERGRALAEARKAWVGISDLAIAMRIQYEQTGYADPRMMDRFHDLAETFEDLLSERQPAAPLLPRDDPFSNEYNSRG